MGARGGVRARSGDCREPDAPARGDAPARRQRYRRLSVPANARSTGGAAGAGDDTPGCRVHTGPRVSPNDLRAKPELSFVPGGASRAPASASPLRTQRIHPQADVLVVLSHEKRVPPGDPGLAASPRPGIDPDLSGTAVLDMLSAGVALVAPDGAIIFVNRAWTALFGTCAADC